MTEPSEQRLPVDQDATGRSPPASSGRALRPMFTDGGRPGPGRPKGSPNRTTVAMKNAISTVFEDLQAGHGGEGAYPHFLAWAKANPTEFYRMAARQLPVHVAIEEPKIGLVVFKGIND